MVIELHLEIFDSGMKKMECVFYYFYEQYGKMVSFQWSVLGLAAASGGWMPNKRTVRGPSLSSSSVKLENITSYTDVWMYDLAYKRKIQLYSIEHGRDSSVGIATRYGLDGPGIESRWGARFSAPVQPGPGASPASCTMGTGSFPGVKRPGRGADHPPTSKCRGHERVGLYLYSPSGPSWPVIGRTFTFTFTQF